MSKLPSDKQFLDLSDYGRPLAKQLCQRLYPTPVTAIHLTWMFIGVAGIAIWAILNQHFILAALLLPIKSTIDAADGQMARLRNKPSYVGRYLDSIADMLLNILFFFSIANVTQTSLQTTLIAILCFQLQGSLYNYYYVIKRHQDSGDTTSRVNEKDCPPAYPYESQKTVRTLHALYLLLYYWQDKIIQAIDPNAQNEKMPNYILTLVSVLGLGFQLVLMSLCLISTPQWAFPMASIGLSTYAICVVLLRKASTKRK